MSSTSTSIRRSSMVELRAPDFLDWIFKGGVDPNLLELLHICSEDVPHTTPAPGPEQSGDVDPDPDAFDDMGLQYPLQTTPTIPTPASDAFDGMDLQSPPHTTPTIRSPSPLVHNSPLDSRNDSDDSDDSDSDAVDEVVPYVPFKASPSAFLPEAPFRFASEERYPAPSPAPSFDSHNALQLDLGLRTPAFASVTVEQVITPVSPRPSRTRTNNVALLEAALHAEDAEDSDDNASDEEYVPPTRSTMRKRRRVARSSSYASHVPAKRPRPTLPPRNIQLPLLPDSPLDSAGDILSLYTSEANPWLCVCGWEQKNHRMPDLKRHIRTHTQDFEPARWVCCGVPLAQAPAGVSTLHPVVHNGELRVGGCMAKFSRRDALRRHLQNENIHCIGEVVEQPLYTL